MLISLNGIQKSFGDKLILNELSATIEDNDRIGLVGANGIGKSTLLNIINSELEPDGGELSVTRGVNIGMLKQNSGLNRENTIYEEMKSVYSELEKTEKRLRELEALIAAHDGGYDGYCEEYSHLSAYFEAKEGYDVDVKIKTVLNGMGFIDKAYDMSIASLSGGEKTRLAIAKLLLENPSLLILDEPTNHLDFKTLMWLEDYLLGYKGGLLVVSHDRYFLDKMVNKVWELENKKVVSYNGNYSKYKLLRTERITRMKKEYETQQNKINSMLDYAQRNIVRATTSNMAKSRIHQVENIELLERPDETIKTPNFRFTFEKNPIKAVLTVADLKLTVGENDDKLSLCENIGFEIRRGDKVAIIGPNGVGKSTLLKTLLTALPETSKLRTQGSPPEKGEIFWGDNVQVSYYEQENLTLNPENTALEELWSRFPLLPQHEVRAILGRVLITGDNSFKKIGVLSGGERARVALAIIMAEHSNTLILDEPTNHLDLQSKEELEKSLIEFEGTLLFVSHDRYFLNTIPNKIIELDKNGLTLYNGNFDFYLEQSAKAQSAENAAKPSLKSAESGGNSPAYRSKQMRAEEVKRKNELKRLEDNVSRLEFEIAETEALIATDEVACDYARLNELCADLESKRAEHDDAFEQWLSLTDE